MSEFLIGSFVLSKAGRDNDKCYVIFQLENEYVYLVDGKLRTIDRPKKKKIKHIQKLDQYDRVLADKIKDKTIKNEEIKRAIKLLQVINSSKEVE